MLQAQLLRKLPKVADHLENNLECGVGAVASSWFATLFTTLLPSEVSTAAVGGISVQLALASYEDEQEECCSSVLLAYFIASNDTWVNCIYDLDHLLHRILY